MYMNYSSHNMSKSIAYSRISNSNQSLLTEPQQITLQKEVDLYTKKVEQEKRKKNSIQETHQIVLKEYLERKEKQIEIKRKQQDTDSKLMGAKIRNLEFKIEQMISKKNASMTINNQLKFQIDSLRKEKQNHIQICENLQQEIQQTNLNTQNIIKDIEEKLQQTQETEDQVMLLKKKNDMEKINYYKQFDNVKQKVIEDKRQRNENRVIQRINKQEIAIDLHGVMKQRLKKLIYKNKEKVKVIEQYQKIMKVIDESFSQIKEGSGITDIQEITNTFIKSEEQNYSLYKYVDILLQDIDYLKENNSQLEQKCQDQLEENLTKERLLAGTPDDERSKRKLQKLTVQKKEKIDRFLNSIKDIKPHLEQILIDLASSNFSKEERNQKLFDYKMSFDLSEQNLEQYLSDLEEYINLLIEFKNSQQINHNNNSINHTLMYDEIPVKEAKQGPKQFSLQLAPEDNAQWDNQKIVFQHSVYQAYADEILKKKSLQQQQQQQQVNIITNQVK